MIDWLTLSLPIGYLGESGRAVLARQQGYIQKFDKHGVLEWLSPARQSIRSDSHQLGWYMSEERLWLHGSPARVDSANNVFGSGDIRQCAFKMISWAMFQLDVLLPHDLNMWLCSRIDKNFNYYLGSEAFARQMLMHYRNADGGRYQIRTKAESVYFGTSQSRVSGKIYNKGCHLEYQVKKKQAQATEDEIQLCKSVVRLEIKIGNRFLNDCPIHWSRMTEQFLNDMHAEYFAPFVGVEGIYMNDDIIKKLVDVTGSERKAKNVFSHWLQIQQIGFQQWRDFVSPATFYRVKKVLLKAGFSYADFQSGNIVPIRRRSVTLGEPVKSWDDLKKVAGM